MRRRLLARIRRSLGPTGTAAGASSLASKVDTTSARYSAGARFLRAFGATLALVSLLITACGSPSTRSANPTTLQTASVTPGGSPRTDPSPSAPQASAAGPGGVVVIGHSGATGWNSNPARPGLDAPENSWATGTNPAVNSIYLRLVAADPTYAGQANNYAISGSDVLSLKMQAETAVGTNPKPRLVLVQSIDNDVRCDGTDAENYEPFRASLTDVLDTLTNGLPDARIFFVDQWANWRTYDQLVLAMKASKITGSGPCDVVDPGSGKINRDKEAYGQSLIDAYFKIITDTCARYRTCRTDGGANQAMLLVREDLTPDLDHLSVNGQAKMAAIEYAALEAAFRSSSP